MKPGKSKDRRDGDRPRKSDGFDKPAPRARKSSGGTRASKDEDDLSSFFKTEKPASTEKRSFSDSNAEGDFPRRRRGEDNSESPWSKSRHQKKEDGESKPSSRKSSGEGGDDWSFNLDEKPARRNKDDDDWGSERKPRRSFSDKPEGGSYGRRRDDFDRDSRPARRSGEEGGEDRPARGFGGRGSFDKKESGFSRKRQDDLERNDRSSGRSGERDSEDRPRRNSEGRSFGERREGGFSRGRQDGYERSGNRRFEKEDRPRRSFGDGEQERPYKPRADREGSDERGFRGRRTDDRERKSFDGDRPYRRSSSRDDANSSGEKRPYRERKDSSNGDRPYRKSFSRDDAYSSGEKRPYRERKDSYRDGAGKDKTRDRKSSNTPVKAMVREDMRLNKYLSNSGICSRREADVLISTGVVTVNGKVVTEMGFRVSPGDVVVYGGQAIKPERNVYLLLNKPKDFITTSDDPQNRKTVMQLVEGACKERIYPVGRLDRNTTGLLLMTNDGNLADLLSHPASKVRKIYHVTLDKNISARELNQLVSEGVNLEDGNATVDEAEFVDEQSRKEVGITLHSGRNRIVRRMFDALGYNVIKLDRVSYAGLTKKDLPRGRWRMLSEKEVGFLRMNAK